MRTEKRSEIICQTNTSGNISDIFIAIENASCFMCSTKMSVNAKQDSSKGMPHTQIWWQRITGPVTEAVSRFCLTINWNHQTFVNRLLQNYRQSKPMFDICSARLADDVTCPSIAIILQQKPPRGSAIMFLMLENRFHQPRPGEGFKASLNLF